MIRSVYPIVKKLLFTQPAERAHHMALSALKTGLDLPVVGAALRRQYASPTDERLAQTLFGLRFPNPVGLAAGFDKDAQHIDQLADLGFGFIEIGTLTPRPQVGNPQPRLFRLPTDEALINRMGFNNGGVAAAVERLKKRTSTVIIGGNIGKNKTTPNERATDDYTACFESLFDYVDYFVINVSSPNTPNLRALQEKEPLTRLILALRERNEAKSKPKPILLKIAPDLTNPQLDDIIEIVAETELSGVIATNTTIAREPLKTSPNKIEQIGAGGLSGQPLRQRSTEVIRYLADQSQRAFPIVGVGGIQHGADALEKLTAGASLVQLYTGFVYGGPATARRINEHLLAAGWSAKP